MELFFVNEAGHNFICISMGGDSENYHLQPEEYKKWRREITAEMKAHVRGCLKTYF